MITGFSMLPPRSSNIDLPNGLLELPKSFQFYLNYYYQSLEELPFIVPKVFIAKDNYYYQIGWGSDYSNGLLKIQGDRIVGMETIDDIEKNLKLESYWNQSDFLFIGSTIVHHILLDLCKNRTFGKIYLQNREATKDEYLLVADDIFDFFQKIKLIIDEETLTDLNIKPTQLYRNWGEDFWRVREDEK